jgi:Ser/Thr protein kinase RdoA (MazF antagonist)
MSGHIQTMNAPPPDFTAEDATWITWQKFGIQTMARPLAGERDLNFRMTDTNRRDYVLKIWNSTQDPEAVRFQLAVMAHVAATDPDLQIPGVISSLNGEDCLSLKDSNGISHPAGLLSWLDGMFMRNAPVTDALKSSLGRALARLDRAMTGFRDPAENRDLLWNVCNTGQIRGMVDDIPHAALKDLAGRSIDRFEAETKPALQGLRRQVIHNDFNPDNVLVDPYDDETVAGIIDFGDVMRNPLICDPAIACAYQLSGTGDPVDDLLPLVTAYHEEFPLEGAELDVLTGLVCARLLCSVVITRRMAALFPENRDYLLGDSTLAESRLSQLGRMDWNETGHRFREACGVPA